MQRIPLSTEREAELAIQLQFLVAIRHNGPYLQFILCFDPAQGCIYHGPLNNHRFQPNSRKVFNRLGNAMARVGFLKLEVASIPGAVEAWAYEVNFFLPLVPDSVLYLPEHGYYGFYSFEPNTARYSFPGSINYTPENVSFPRLR